MPITNQGYIRPSYDELLEDCITLAKELFGDDIDTNNDSPLGKFIRLGVQDLADAYEAQEIIYYSRFPNTATGQSLDRLMPFAAISRNPGTRAEHTIKFIGTAGAVIDPGFLVGTTGDETFFLVNSVTLGDNGTATGLVQCTEFGTIGNVAAGTITEIVNPAVDVTSIQHMSFDTAGQDTETDSELRKRFKIALAGAGSGATSAIKGAVMRITGVTSCYVDENSGNETSATGVPPHAFEVYVYASETLNQEIAEAIFSKKPVGIGTHGDVSVTVIDDSGNQQTVKFSHVQPMPVYIKLTAKVNSYFELDGITQIKDAMTGYVGSLAAGDDVIFTNLYKYIFGVAGVEDVTSLSISSDGTNYASSNISVDFSKIATLAASNIEVTINEN